MANNCVISSAAREAAMDAVTLLFNTGGAGTLEIYDGTQPAGPDTAIGLQTLLAVLPLSVDAFGDAVAGVATAGAITSDTTADASGTASWFRIKDGAGTAVVDGSVGTAAADLVLGTTTITAGNTVAISSFTLTMPAVAT